MQMVGCARAYILGIACTKLQWPLDIGGLQATSTGAFQVIVVGSDQHDIVGGHIKRFCHAAVSTRIGLVSAKHFRTQDAIPGQTGALGQAGEQIEVAVGEGAKDKARF